MADRLVAPSELLLAIAELEPSASLSPGALPPGALPKLQLDVRELGSAVFEEGPAAEPDAEGASDEDGWACAGSGCPLVVDSRVAPAVSVDAAEAAGGGGGWGVEACS